MLSRSAEHLYWMSRYLERAEHTARVAGVELNLMLDCPPLDQAGRWRRLLAALQATVPDQSLNDPYAVAYALTFDPANPSSIIAAVGRARDNARQVRDLISSEMWELLNELFLYVSRAEEARAWHTQPNEFLWGIKERAHAFQGITDSTMRHGEGWYFIEVGRYLERAQLVASMVDTHFTEFHTPEDPEMDADEYLEWVALLKSCTAFEAYCKVHTAQLSSECIAEFLVLDAYFPHSVRFAADRMRLAFRSIAGATGTLQRTALLHRLVGRLTSAVRYTVAADLLPEGLHAFLVDIQRRCEQIHAALDETYFYHLEELQMEP